MGNIKSNISLGFGKRIKAIRLNLGITQEELSEKVNVHRTYIGMIERGEKNVTLDTIQKLSISLNISISDLFKDI